MLLKAEPPRAVGGVKYESIREGEQVGVIRHPPRRDDWRSVAVAEEGLYLAVRLLQAVLHYFGCHLLLDCDMIYI
ncbi:hypothetical protein J6590_015894 [Homalodisca vitripennis]|nr:hypothetical protein J6590_015894 [Homalodisca vitripennis]